MKYNDGDMDDLFRRASEGYPLRTDSADWDRLAGALNGESAAPSDQEEKRRRRGLFWWFLLIPLAGVGYLTWQVGLKRTSDRGMVVAPKDGTAAKVRSGKVTAPATGAGAGQDGSGTPGQPSNTVGGGTARQAENAGTGGDAVRKVRTRKDGGANTGDFHGSRMDGGSAGENVRGNRGGDQRISGGGKVRKMRTVNAGGTNAAGLNGTNAAALNGTNAAGNDGDGDHDPALALLDLRRAPIGGGYEVVVEVKAPMAAAKNMAQAATKHSHGYIGVFGAPDFSTVRFQSMKGVGTTLGVLLGYSFNDRWAVETGLSLDRKRYYTSGEYFKKSMPPGYTLLNVDGTCYMWEIPVNVRYNFNKSPGMKWFATAGLSTYLMSKEDYTYQWEANWVTGEGAWNIHKPSQYWFSIVNLSAGFEQRLGKIGNLRLEPYVRIPLSGIGTGNLPIMSAGVNIGFTRQLW